MQNKSQLNINIDPTTDVLHVKDSLGNIVSGLDASGVPFGYAANPLQSTVSISAAKLNDMVNNPIVLVPAPGPNKVIVPIIFVYHYRPGTTPFTPHVTQLVSAYDPDFPIAYTITAGVFDTLNETLMYPGYDQTESVNIPSVWDNPSLMANKPVLLTGDLSGGDGSLRVYSTYMVIDLS